MLLGSIRITSRLLLRILQSKSGRNQAGSEDHCGDRSHIKWTGYKAYRLLTEPPLQLEHLPETGRIE